MVEQVRNVFHMVICLVAEGKNHLTYKCQTYHLPLSFPIECPLLNPPKNGVQNGSLASKMAILGVYVEFS